MILYDTQARVVHEVGPNPGTQYTKCMIDAGSMVLTEDRDMYSVIYCANCFQIEFEEVCLEDEDDDKQ